MNLFCRLFGHTWIPQTRVPKTRWTTTKNAHELEASLVGDGEGRIAHMNICVRCGEEQADRPRKHDED